MKTKQKSTYIPPVLTAIVVELEQGIAAGSATVQPSTDQPSVTDWGSGGTTDQSFEL